MTLPSSTITDHKGRLLNEILSGSLFLVGTNLVRYNFCFSVGEAPVGIYGIRSYGEKKIRAIRSWNRGAETWDPINGIFVPTRGRQFGKIASGTPLFLVEFDQGFKKVVDKIAFKARTVRVKDAVLPSIDKSLRFEEVDLEDLEILG